MLTIYLFFRKRSAFRLPIKGILFACLYGIICFAIGMSFYSLSVDNIPISVATVLMFSNPIWATLFGKIFFWRSNQQEETSYYDTLSNRLYVHYRCVFSQGGRAEYDVEPRHHLSVFNRSPDLPKLPTYKLKRTISNSAIT